MTQQQTKNPALAVNATLFWPNLKIVNPKSKKYQVDLSNLSPAAVTALSEQGVNIRNKNDERGDFITCKSQYPIVPLTPEGEEIEAMVGNGSTATVGLRIRSGRHPEFGPYVVASIQRLTVNEIVEYEGSDDDDIDYADAL